LSSNNANQIICHPVPGGSMIIIRYGLVFRVILDGPEGLSEMSQEWVRERIAKLRAISSLASRVILNCGLKVEVYGL